MSRHQFKPIDFEEDPIKQKLQLIPLEFENYFWNEILVENVNPTQKTV